MRPCTEDCELEPAISNTPVPALDPVASALATIIAAPVDTCESSSCPSRSSSHLPFAGTVTVVVELFAPPATFASPSNKNLTFVLFPALLTASANVEYVPSRAGDSPMYNWTLPPLAGSPSAAADNEVTPHITLADATVKAQSEDASALRTGLRARFPCTSFSHLVQAETNACCPRQDRMPPCSAPFANHARSVRQATDVVISQHKASRNTHS